MYSLTKAIQRFRVCTTSASTTCSLRMLIVAVSGLMIFTAIKQRRRILETLLTESNLINISTSFSQGLTDCPLPHFSIVHRMSQSARLPPKPANRQHVATHESGTPNQNTSSISHDVYPVPLPRQETVSPRVYYASLVDLIWTDLGQVYTCRSSEMCSSHPPFAFCSVRWLGWRSPRFSFLVFVPISVWCLLFFFFLLHFPVRGFHPVVVFFSI